MEYTKGEWFYDRARCRVETSGNERPLTVADINSMRQGYDGNGFLIASAPDMYEALKALMKEYWLGTCPDEDATSNWANAQKALDKAEGK